MRGQLVERIARLVVMVTQRDGHVPSVSDLAERFGVSTRTIWRDVDALRTAGLEIRFPYQHEEDV